VTAFSEKSKPYLDACIKSIRALLYPNFEVRIVSPERYNPQYEGALTICPQEPYTNAHALNIGARHADGEYLFFLNDDVILTPNCLSALVSMSGQAPAFGVLMPYGNDTNLNLYSSIQGTSGAANEFRHVRPGMYRLESLEPGQLELMMAAESVYPPLLCRFDMLCMYAALIPRRAWEAVGPFDDKLSGLDDADYSQRMRNAGYFMGIAFNSLVWHACGPTADETYDARARDESRRAFEQKWRGA